MVNLVQDVEHVVAFLQGRIQGEGQVRTCLALLKVDDYTGWLSLEVGGDPVAEVVHGAEVVAEAWGGRV